MNDEIKSEIERDQALNIIMDNIVEITNIYSTTKDKNISNELKEKIDVLNKIKDEIYLGNNNIIKNVIEKNRKGIL